MIKRSTGPRLRLPNLDLRSRDLFYLEQWIALLIGLLCLGVSGWAGFSRAGDPVSAPPSWLSEYALVRMKCSLAVAVALIGTALIRFAFFKPLQRNRSAAAPGQEPIAQKKPNNDVRNHPAEKHPGDGAGNKATRLQLVTHRRRG